MILTSAPATLMLMGEHAVLRNYPCLVAAANLRLKVKLKARVDQNIHLTSSLGSLTTSLTNLEMTAPFTFVLSVIKQFQHKLKHGFELEITSDFGSAIGLGSSAATLIATTAALFHYSHNQAGTQTEIFNLAKKSLLEVQGLGSGADLAAALLGGIVYYQMKPLHIEKLPEHIELSLIYSGSKMATVDVVKKVNQACDEAPELYQKHFQEISTAVELGKTALLNNDIPALADAFIVNQNIMEAMQLSNTNIDEIIKRLNEDAGILAAKISGSGLGDCVIGLGKLFDHKFPGNDFEQRQGIKSIPIELSSLGLIYHD